MSAPKTNRVEQKTKWDARRIVVAVLALAMAVLMLLPLVTNVFLFSHAVTKEDIEALRQQKQSIASGSTLWKRRSACCPIRSTPLRTSLTNMM